MASTTTTLAPTHEQTVLKLRGDDSTSPDFLQELATNGFCVVKNVVSEEKAASYRSQAYDWLESFGLGFDRSDKSTWDVKNVPPNFKGGMYHVRNVAHEDFVWALRSEPKLLDIYAKIWGTDKLISSFDGINLALPPVVSEQVKSMSAPWPHVDQSPLDRGLTCVQGIVNLAHSGPEDGGLMVLAGSKPLYNQFFDEHAHEAPEGGWSRKAIYLHTDSQLQWFYDHGCKWVKICCEPGDLMLWDSRCVHYGSVPKGQNARSAAYVCYKPASMISPENLTIKQKAFKEEKATSHDPCSFFIQETQEAWLPFMKPINPDRVWDDKVLKLAGMMPYE